MFQKFAGEKYLIVLPIFLAAFILVSHLNKPFVGHHDFTGAFNGVIAKNYLQHGVLNLKFGQAGGFITDINAKHSYYTHYLPLLPLLIALSFCLFGVVEWAERLVPAIFSLIGVISLFLICRKLWNTRTGLLAGILFIFTPMYIYFGNMPVAEPVILGLGLLSIYFYLQWLENKSAKKLILLSSALFVGGLVGWPIVYLGPLLILHSLLLKKFDRKLLIAQLALFSTILLLFLHAFILTGDFFGGGLIDTFKNRFGEQQFSFGGESFTVLNYIRKEISWLQAYFTRILLILAFAGSLLQLRHKFNIQNITLLTIFLFGISHIILFSRYVFVHDFLNIYLLPFLAISAALAIDRIINYLRKIRINNIVIILITLLILFLFITERLDFTRALLATAENRQGLEMANTINGLQTQPNQLVIVSPRFSNFYGIFTNFYVQYPYQFASETEFKNTQDYKKYRYIIMIDEDIIDKSKYQFLIANYPYRRLSDLTIFEIDEK